MPSAVGGTVRGTGDAVKQEQRAAQDRMLRRLRDDFAYYAERVIKIPDKLTGQLVPLVFNRSQRYIHAMVEKQRQETGRVRALLVKARQPGGTTYVSGRYYWKTSMRFGQQAMTLAHKDEATAAIFSMIERCYDNDKTIHPHIDRSNTKELRFDRMRSGFRAATAGGRAVGHSTTNRLVHGSEVAYWPNPTEIMKGVGQTVPNADDTEIILESTGNGRGTWFHNIVRDAEKGLNEYIVIFVPWFWSEDYATELPPTGFDFSPEDREYQDLFKLTDEQLYWRRLKIDSPDFRGDVLAFQESYPATLNEAFISREGSFISGRAIAKARKCVVEEPVGALVLGADPTAYGKDRYAITGRVGRKQVFKEAHTNWGAREGAQRLAQLIHEGIQVDGRGRMHPAKVFVDKVGVGHGTIALLEELGYGEFVVGVAGSESVIDPDRHFNKKAEMWDAMKEWVEDEPCDLVDDDDVEADMLAPRYERDVTGQRLKIESKESLRRRNVPSPDNAEALALTFSYPVADDAGHTDERGNRTAPRRIRRRERHWQA